MAKANSSFSEVQIARRIKRGAWGRRGRGASLGARAAARDE